MRSTNNRWAEGSPCLACLQIVRKIAGASVRRLWRKRVILLRLPGGRPLPYWLPAAKGLPGFVGFGLESDMVGSFATGWVALFCGEFRARMPRNGFAFPGPP